jgi:hypothetical protein
MSEPVFEASVRLRADTSTVEQDAAQGIKRGLDRVEQQAQARSSTFEQRAAQRAQQQAALDAKNEAERSGETRRRRRVAKPLPQSRHGCSPRWICSGSPRLQPPGLRRPGC